MFRRQQEVASTMNPQVPDELISAYFDGEASPEERAVVERLLAENEDARRELNEVSRLSAMLHSFPREFAPVELASNVEQQTRQRPIPAVAAPPSPVRVTSSRFREWKAAFIGALVSSACLGLAALSLNRFGVPQGGGESEKTAEFGVAALPRERGKLLAPAPVAAPAGVALMDSVSREVKSRGVQEDLPRVAEPVGRDVAKYSDAAVVATGVPGLKQAVGKPQAAMAPMEKRMATNGLTSAPAEGVTQLGISNAEFVNGLKVGMLLQPVDPDNNVGVVELIVVDVKNGADQLQGFMLQNDIRPLIGEEKSRQEAQNLNEPPAAEVFVYSVATGEQLANTIKLVENRPDLFRGWYNQQPLQLDAKPAEAKAAELAAADKSTDAKQAKAASRDEVPVVDAEAELALNVYLERNLQVASANPDGSGSTLRDGNDTRGMNRKADATSQAGGGIRARAFAIERGNKGDGDQQATQVLPPAAAPVSRNESAAKYQMMRRSVTDVFTNPSNSALNNSVSSNLAENSVTKRNPLLASAQESQSRVDASNRAVKMLWVLHPAPSEPAAASPPAAKAGK